MINNNLVDNVRNSGLTDKEAAVYIALLESGGGFPSQIATKSGIKRSTAYKILLDLSIKGLVNGIEKKNKLYYQPEKPDRLVRHSKNLMRLAEDYSEHAVKILPDLEELFSSISRRPKVLFFEGPDAIKNICDDMISGREKYEMVAFSNADKFKNALSPKDLRQFVEGKERLGITTRGILPNTDNNRDYAKHVFRGVRKSLWPRMRFVPHTQFPFEAELTVYGKNKVSIVKLGKENIIGVIIEDEVIHGMMRMVFELAWGAAKE